MFKKLTSSLKLNASKSSRVKVKFDIVIERVEWTFGYTKLAGKGFHVEWKCGTKAENAGKTKTLKLADGSDKINFAQKITVTMSLGYKDLKAGVFESKALTFSLMAEGEAKAKGEDAVAGKADLDLATVCNPGKFDPEQSIKLLGKDKKESARNPSLVVKVKAEWQKVDGKKVVAEKEKSSSSVTDDLEALIDTSEIDKDLGSLSKRNKKNKGKSLEQELLDKQSGGSGDGKDKVEINGQSFDLVETDEISEMEVSADEESTDREYLSNSDEEEDPFAAEEAKEAKEAADAAKKKAKSKKDSEDTLSTSTSEDDSKSHRRKSRRDLKSVDSSSSLEDSKDKDKKSRHKKQDSSSGVKVTAAAAAEEPKEDDRRERRRKKKEAEEAEAKKKEEEAEAKKKADEEAVAAKKKKKDDDEAAKKKAEEEAAARKKSNEEASAKKKKDDEAAAKKKAEDEAAAKKKADEEAAKKKKDEEDKQKKEEEAAAKKKKDEEDKKKKDDEAAAKKQADEEAKKKKDEEDKKKKEEEERKTKEADDKKKSDPPAMTKRNSVLDRAQSLDASIKSGVMGGPGGGTPSSTPKTEKKDIDKPSDDAGSDSDSEDGKKKKQKLGHPTANRAKPPPHRQPSRSHLKGDKDDDSESSEEKPPKKEEPKAKEPTKSPSISAVAPAKASGASEEEVQKLKKDLATAQDETKVVQKKLKELQKEFKESLSQHSHAEEMYDTKQKLDEENTKLKAKIAELEKVGSSKSDDKQLKALQAENEALKKKLKKSDDDEDDDDSVKTHSVLNSGSGGSSDETNKLKSELKILKAQLENRDKIDELIYASGWEYAENKYVEDGEMAFLHASATKLAQFLLNAKAMTKKGQFERQNQQMLIDILVAVSRQLTKYAADADSLLGWLHWSLSLLTVLVREADDSIIDADEEESDEESESDEDSGSDDEDKPKKAKQKEVKRRPLTWCLGVDADGLSFKFSTVKEALDNRKGYDAVTDFTSKVDKEGVALRFLRVLDTLISHNYALILTATQAKLEAAKYSQIWFDQASQLSANSATKLDNTKRRAQQQHQHTLGHLSQILNSLVESARNTHKYSHTLQVQIVGQLLSWLGSSLVNVLFNTPALCKAGTAYSIKVSLSHIEQWVAAAHTPQLASERSAFFCSWLNERLEPLREVSNVLLLDKNIFLSPDLSSIFVTLTTAQIGKVLSQFQTDDFAPDPVPKAAVDALQKGVTSSTKVALDADLAVEFPKEAAN